MNGHLDFFSYTRVRQYSLIGKKLAFIIMKWNNIGLVWMIYYYYESLRSTDKASYCDIRIRNVNIYVFLHEDLDEIYLYTLNALTVDRSINSCRLLVDIKMFVKILPGALQKLAS
jgi:hypothetical protein